MVLVLMLLPAAAGILLCLICLNWYRRRSLGRKIKQYTTKVEKLAKMETQQEAVVKKLLKKVYSELDAAIDCTEADKIHKLLDILKLAYSSGVMRQDEPFHLRAVSVKAIRKCEPGLAGFVVDIARPMLKQLTAAKVVAYIEQLTIIGIYALRERHNFLAAKVTDIVFQGLERLTWTKNPGAMVAALKSLGRIGSLALKRNDLDLFKEIGTRIFALLKTDKQGTVQDIKVRQAIAGVLTNWLERAVRSDRTEIIEDLWLFTAIAVKNGIASEDILLDMLKEWETIANTASLNPYSRLSDIIISEILDTAYKQYSYEFFCRIVYEVSQSGILAVNHQELADAFKVIRPLFDLGRKLMVDELKFGVEGNYSFRRQAMFLVVKECLVIIDYLNRKDLLKNSPDVIFEFCSLWQTDESARFTGKSAGKFCNLLLLQWARVKEKQAKKTLKCQALLAAELLSEQEIAKLGFG